MISVQNHLQLLNGSKILLFCLFVFGIASCGGSKKAVSKKKDTRSTKVVKNKPKKKKSSTVIDTVQWTEVSKEEFPPISEKNVEAIDTKDSYKVSLLIPFDAAKANRLTSIENDRNIYRFVNYYGGVNLALQDLEQDGISLLVNVEDSKSTENVTSILKSSSNRDADVIVGPYTNDKLKEAIQYGKENEIPVVSPWRASSKLTKNNPYYVQLRPMLDEHYYKLAESVLSRFSADQVFLIGKEGSKDKARFKYFNKVLRERNGDRTASFPEYMVNSDSLKMGETAFDSIFHVDKASVFIIPNWKGADEDFIYSCLRKLRVEKGPNTVYVFGMPIMLESERVSYDYFRNLNLHVVRSKFVDQENSKVKSFRRRYYDQYGALPTKDAYDGYDMMYYIGNKLNTYGKNFQYHLNKSADQMLQTTYRIDQEVVKSSSELGMKGKVNYFANKHLDIIRFDGTKFVRVR